MIDDFICMNKFSYLESNKINILFTQYETFISDILSIENSNIQQKTVVITGNNDHCITKKPINDKLISHEMPVLFPQFSEKIEKVFAQNCLVDDEEKFEIIPIGIQNYIPNKRGTFHGWIPPHSEERIELLRNKFFLPTLPKDSNKFLYANFRKETNLNHREKIKHYCVNSEHIIWEEPPVSLENYFNSITNSEAVVCAQGNGIGDNHRIYETLYLNRIPITFNKIMYERLHHNFPVILLEDGSQLSNVDLIKNKINIIKNNFPENYKEIKELKFSFWEEKIKNFIDKISKN